MFCSFDSKSIVKTIFFLCFLTTYGSEAVGSGFSTSAVSRSQSMGALAHATEIKPLARTRPVSISSSSSSSIRETVVKPIETVSELREVELQEREHLIEKPKHVRFAAEVDLAEASVPTDSGVNLDPVRDGVFARVRRILAQSAAPVAVGIAAGAVIGAGVVESINSSHVNSTLSTIKNSFSNAINDVNGIVNVI